MTRVLTANVLPDPPADIDFVLIYAGSDGLDWLVREDLALEANKAANEAFLYDLEEAGLY